MYLNQFILETFDKGKGYRKMGNIFDDNEMNEFEQNGLCLLSQFSSNSCKKYIISTL
jgi:hypothetical protein